MQTRGIGYEEARMSLASFYFRCFGTCQKLMLCAIVYIFWFENVYAVKDRNVKTMLLLINQNQALELFNLDAIRAGFILSETGIKPLVF